MDWKLALTAFGAIFLAEMGDKTQLAVITMSASSHKAWSVFLGAALALAAVTALGAFLGGAVTRWVPEVVLKKGAAVLFVGIGLWTWFKG
jgi:putative Ca2+/H+ antiporter (TMEM165/GDT1 family)